MNTVLHFPTKSVRKSESTGQAQKCLVIPFPRLKQTAHIAKQPNRTTQKDKHGRPICMRDTDHPTTPVLKNMELLLKKLSKAWGKTVSWDYAAKKLERLTGVNRLEGATFFELQKVMSLLESEETEAARSAK